MTNVLLSNDDVTVLGPPEIVDVLIDVGSTGTRGSQVFVGIGDPNVVEIGQVPILNDLYINTSPGEDYSYLYQYVSEPGGELWIEILRINPTLYSQNTITTFTNGQAQIIIPVSSIVTVSGTPLTSENFSIRCTVEHENPVAISTSIPALGDDGDNLIINLKAVEHRTDTESGPYGDWAVLEGEIKLHLFISIVPYTEES